MKERGKKPLRNQNPINFTDFNYSAPDLICKKHPNSSLIGVCPICLRERLQNLICSVCGEQNVFTSCPCSDHTRNSNFSDVGSVGRISFLIENEKQIPFSKTPQNKIENHKQKPPSKTIRTEIENEKQKPNSKSMPIGNKSDLDHGEGQKKSGFWRIMKMFTKSKEKTGSEMWVFDRSGGVSRSRSLCSFQDSTSDPVFSSAKISDFNSSSERASNFSETEQRKGSFENRGMRMKIRESDLGNMGESGFIDLKLDDEVKTEFGNMRMGGSCRITERERRGERREKKGKRVWRWILKHNSNWKSRTSKRDEDVIKDINSVLT